MTSNPVTEEKVKEIVREEVLALKENLNEKFDQVFNHLDKVMGQLETIREEQTVGYH